MICGLSFPDRVPVKDVFIKRKKKNRKKSVFYRGVLRLIVDTILSP